MGASNSIERDELTALNAIGVANLISKFDSKLARHRQACIDFGLDGDMLVRLPQDQLSDALCRAGISSEDHLDLLMEELEKIRCPKIDCPKLDRKYLREFIGQMDNHGYDWDVRSDSSIWSGVSINSHDRVVGLDLTNGSLSGELPANLGNMSQLVHLHATSNRIAGSIPEAIGGLTRLTSLRLDHNNITGRFPSALTRLASLTRLDLAWNQITGTVPARVATLTALRRLNLGHNKLSGSIPKELGSMHLLVELRLRENKLTGKIPPLLSNMRSLTSLDLASNGLYGHIPESLGELTALRELWLSDNRLVGSLPETLSKLQALESLDLSSNRLSGRLRERVLAAFPSLIYLRLSHNALEGDLPLGALSSSMDGAVPRALSDADNASAAAGGSDENPGTAREGARPLSYLNLSHNQLAGPILEEIGRFCSLEILDLSHNKLDGGFPFCIGGCVSLRILSFSCCGLSGRLCKPRGKKEGAELWKRLSNLESLRLDGNMFSSCLPSEIGELRRLEVLQLQNNCFEGKLPWALGELDRLWLLNIRDNRISGRVPLSLGRLKALQTLRLDGNPFLRGPIPREIASRSECAISADDAVLEDTEALMLGARLADWFLMPREAFLRLPEFPGYSRVRASLVRFISTLVPYKCHVFCDVGGRRLVVRRREIAFFSHCWDLPRHQCPPGSSVLDGPHPDTDNHDKLRHMKACLEEAHPEIRYVWLDMLCVPLANTNRRRAAGRSLPLFVQNSARFYTIVPDDDAFQKYKTRAWCRLEVLCAACPHRASETESAFSPEDYRQAPFIHDSVEFTLSVWNGGNRVVRRFNGQQELETEGLLGDPTSGKLSDEVDREDVAEATLRVVNATQESGCMRPDTAGAWRSFCYRVLYGSIGPDWATEHEAINLGSRGSRAGEAIDGARASLCWRQE